jgi:uncharacterized membrane protein YhaH (DUF805 family)
MNYFEFIFTGRLNRRQFIIGVITNRLLLLLAIIIYITLIYLGYPHTSTWPQIISISIWAILTVYFVGFLLFLLLSLFGLYTRRIHDIGYSGWITLLCLIPIINIFLLFFLLFKPGNSKANTFGPKPTNNIDIYKDIYGVSKNSTIRKQIKINETTENIILAIVIVIGMYPIYASFSFITDPQNPNINGEQFIVPLLSFLLGLIVIFISLILNKRNAFTLAAWISLPLLFLFLFTQRHSEWAFQYFRNTRNLSVTIFIVYTILHVIVHGAFWIYNKKRKIITKNGLINATLLFLFTIFAYAISIGIPNSLLP